MNIHFKLDTTVNYAGLVLRLVGATQAFWNKRVILAEIPLVREPAGYACIGQVDVAIPKGYTGFTPMLYISSGSLKKTNIYPYGNTESLFDIITQFDSINVSIDNTFPLGGNLPDIKQWDFIRNCMIIGGLTPIVSQTRVQFYKVSEILDVTRAVDWTNKLNAASAVKVKPSLGNNWAQRNQIKFKEDEDSTRKPDFSIDIADETLKTDRDWAELDFAASLNNTAIHYISTANGATYEDVDIEPRFFQYNAATESLNFTQDLYGEGLKAKYASLQAAIEKPVIIEATVRLTEIDLATLDLTRPVYLAQFGRYYHVLKVQTGKTDECKVELLQIA